jgi:uncharacterized protein
MRIKILENTYSLCKLLPTADVPKWHLSSTFYTITKTNDELSIVCETAFVPDNVQQSKGWRLLQIAAILDLSLTGITATFSTALANAGVNLCVIATFNTDYILVQDEKLALAKQALQNVGFSFE